jgi:hypothetical protein
MLTLLVGGYIAVRGHWRYPLTHGVLALCAVIPLLGVSVYHNPIEAFRVVAPIQAVLLVLLLDRRPAPGRGGRRLAAV